jgi:hypothetical protein
MKPTPPEAEKKLGKGFENFAQHPARPRSWENSKNKLKKPPARNTRPCTRSSETRPSRTRHV